MIATTIRGPSAVAKGQAYVAMLARRTNGATMLIAPAAYAIRHKPGEYSTDSCWHSQSK